MTGNEAVLSRRDRAVAGLAGGLGPPFVRALGATWRARIIDGDRSKELRRSGRSVIFALWHGHLLPLGYLYRGQSIHVLSSWHRDGEINARLMTGIGYGVVRGSTSRGSARGLIGMVSKLRQGFDIGITPDGPRGPARRVQQGIFYLSDKSGAPIVPLGLAARPATRMSSWDGFLVPWPFARVAVVEGAPIAAGSGGSPEERAAALERAFGELCRRAEELVL